VRLGSSVVDSTTLLATERRDLNQRGLTAVLPLTDRVPGVHVLEVIWNPAGAEDTTRVYRIPFLFTPDQELGASDGAEPRLDPPPF
jgi:hypothetical protein